MIALCMFILGCLLIATHQFVYLGLVLALFPIVAGIVNIVNGEG